MGIALIAILVSVNFTACSSDNEEENNGGGTVVSDKVLRSITEDDSDSYLFSIMKKSN